MTDDRPDRTHGGLDGLRSFWDHRADQGKTDCDRVDQSPRAQYMRFDAFLRFNDASGCSILDVGCGTGDFFEHLRARNIRCDYTGIDLSDRMVARARERFPDQQFLVADSLDGLSGRKFDYTIAIGIHNVKTDGARDILITSMRQQFALCTKAAHLSLLTDRYGGFGPQAQAWRAEEILSEALAISPYVTLRHDYLPNDFSVTLCRKPLIDVFPPPVAR